jgi:3-carboxy-cis,cis-muconate cycloisomerase
MTARLVDSLATTAPLAAIFADESVLQSMLDFEAALAAAEAQVGIIPQGAADAIRAAASLGETFDANAIAEASRESGTPAIPLVKALTSKVAAADAESGRFVHWGATSQDVADSALVLTLAKARVVLAGDHARLDKSLRALSERHARTVMLGRTLLQPAVPITFGLKVAGWVAALARGWARVDAAFDAALLLQFGGAAGTLAALGDRGPAVARELAGALKLRAPEAPWHTHRDRLAALVAALGIYGGSLGKAARDISLLMQDEVGETSEPGGGSSSMPQKRNPSACAIALAAAVRLPGLVAAYLAAMVQEHERAVGGWHAEWPTIAATVQTTGAALAAMAGAADDLTVDADRMRANIERTNGAVFAERAMVLLAPRIGKEAAQTAIAGALDRTRSTNQRFATLLMENPEIMRVLSQEQLRTLETPEDYLGSAETMRIALLG